MADTCWRSHRASALCLILIFTVIASAEFAAASASRKAPVVYSRSTVTIANPPNNTGEEEAEPPEPVSLSAQIRPASTFGDPGMMLSQPLMAGQAFLIPLETEKSYALQFARVYTPVDILAIDAEGTIQKIVPQLILHDLQRPLPLPPQTAAVMYLSGGEVEAQKIRPKQRVTHSLFTPPPRILQ